MKEIIDPEMATEFLLTTSPGSPYLNSVEFPQLSGVASYKIRFESGGRWSNYQMARPFVEFDFPSNTDAIDFVPLDATGKAASISDVFLFAASFASAGDVSGTLFEAQGLILGDGYSELLWKNATGEADIWELNGTSIIGGGSLGNPGPSWYAVGTGDFNGDGFSDILWQNSTREVVIWELNGTSVIGVGSLGNPGPTWHV